MAMASAADDPTLAFLAQSAAPAGLGMSPFGMSGFLDQMNLTPEQQAELLASVQAAQLQGNQT